MYITVFIVGCTDKTEKSVLNEIKLKDNEVTSILELKKIEEFENCYTVNVELINDEKRDFIIKLENEKIRKYASFHKQPKSITYDRICSNDLIPVIDEYLNWVEKFISTGETNRANEYLQELKNASLEAENYKISEIYFNLGWANEVTNPFISSDYYSKSCSYGNEIACEKRDIIENSQKVIHINNLFMQGDLVKAVEAAENAIASFRWENFSDKNKFDIHDIIAKSYYKSFENGAITYDTGVIFAETVFHTKEMIKYSDTPETKEQLENYLYWVYSKANDPDYRVLLVKIKLSDMEKHKDWSEYNVKHLCLLKKYWSFVEGENVAIVNIPESFALKYKTGEEVTLYITSTSRSKDYLNSMNVKVFLFLDEKPNFSSE